MTVLCSRRRGSTQREIRKAPRGYYGRGRGMQTTGGRSQKEFLQRNVEARQLQHPHSPQVQYMPTVALCSISPTHPEYHVYFKNVGYAMYPGSSRSPFQLSHVEEAFQYLIITSRCIRDPAFPSSLAKENVRCSM